MLNILCVCTGNTCRSPMTEAIFKQQLAALKLPYSISVASAGLSAFPGAGATILAVRALKKEGVNLDNHAAALISEDKVNEADLIFVMTAAQFNELLERFPAASGKTYLLKEYAGISDVEKDIADPIGPEPRKYQHAMEEIKNAVKKIITRIKEEYSGK